MRRIVPALLVVVVAVLLCGVVLLDPLRLEVLAGDGVASLLFYSNVHYLAQGGYFGAPPYQNWLLQTWSLSVEWQFYIVFPVLLAALRWLDVKRLGTICVLAALAVLSFVKTLSGSSAGGGFLDAVFYLLPGRGWEFLVGALCAYVTPGGVAPRTYRSLMHYAGLVAIFAGMMLFGVFQPWPSAQTLIPVCGTAIVLTAEHADAGWAKCRATRTAGLWSYSIYLWHWPVAAILAIKTSWSLPIRIVGITAAIGLAGLSYRYVENASTRFFWNKRARLVTMGLPVFAASVMIAWVVLVTGGLETVRFAFRPSLRARLADYRSAMVDWRFPKSCDDASWSATNFALCTFGDPKARDVLVIGDSFAEQITSRYTGVFKGTQSGLSFVTHGGCFLLPDVDNLGAGSKCARWSREAYAYASNEPFKRVVFIAHWSSYIRPSLCPVELPACGHGLGGAEFDAILDDCFRRMGALWRGLKDQGKDIVVMTEIPFGGGDPKQLYQQAISGTPVDTRSLPLATFNQDMPIVLARLGAAAAQAGARLIDPAVSLCPTGSCPIVESGRTLFMDDDHLRSSMMIQPRFAFLDRYLKLDQGSRDDAKH